MRSSQNGHISCLFPTRPARRKWIFSGCGWWRADGVERFWTWPIGACFCQCLSWAVKLKQGDITSQLILGLLVETLSRSGEIPGWVCAGCARPLWASVWWRQIRGFIEGIGSDGWVPRLAKFNTWSVTVIQGVSTPKRDGEPLQCCLVFMLSGCKCVCVCVQCILFGETFQFFLNLFVSISRTCLEVGWCSGLKNTVGSKLVLIMMLKTSLTSS